MDKNSELLEKVIIFLILLVSAILIFSQYQFSKVLSGHYSAYLAIVLILVLVVLVVWMFMEKKSSKKSNSWHAAHEPHVQEKPAPWTFMEKLSYTLVALIAAIILFNHVQISQASALAGLNTATGLILKSTSIKTSLALTGDPAQDAITVVIPRGTPFYGEALGVSFEDPINSLEIIAQLDPAYGGNKVQLTPEEKRRYIQIGTVESMGCQYCCGADTLVTSSGGPTCGCKHSWAMRGLAAYLIKNYPDLSDAEIMREMSKWKGLFFPKQMVAKYMQEAQTGRYSPDIASLLLDVDESKLKEAKQSVASANEQQSQTVADVSSLPDMVGGC